MMNWESYFLGTFIALLFCVFLVHEDGLSKYLKPFRCKRYQ